MLKQIALIGSMILTTTSFAGESILIGKFTVAEKKSCFRDRGTSKAFALNNVRDTAVVEVTFTDSCAYSSSEDPSPTITNKVGNPAKLQLSADGVISATIDGKLVECGYKKKVLNTYVKQSGDCEIKLSYKEFSKKSRSASSYDVNTKNYTEVSVSIEAAE